MTSPLFPLASQEIDERIGLRLEDLLAALRVSDKEKALELLDRALRCAMHHGEHKGTIESFKRVENLVDDLLRPRPVDSERG